MEEAGAWKIPVSALLVGVAGAVVYAALASGAGGLHPLDATKVIVYMMIAFSGIVCLLAIGLHGSVRQDRKEHRRAGLPEADPSLTTRIGAQRSPQPPRRFSGAD
jgi:NhaP-type Na+/H+ or K+/H+ antiporter